VARSTHALSAKTIDINGVQINNLNISNSLSYAVQIVDPGGGVVTNATMSGVNVVGYALGVNVFSTLRTIVVSNVFVDGVFGVLAPQRRQGQYQRHRSRR